MLLPTACYRKVRETQPDLDGVVLNSEETLAKATVSRRGEHLSLSISPKEFQMLRLKLKTEELLIIFHV